MNAALSNRFDASGALNAGVIPNDTVLTLQCISAYANPNLACHVVYRLPGGNIQSSTMTMGAIAAETIGQITLTIGGAEILSAVTVTLDNNEYGELFSILTLGS